MVSHIILLIDFPQYQIAKYNAHHIHQTEEMVNLYS